MELYNTPTKRLESFKPIESNVVKIYTCGPTVYSFQHIGNLRTYIFADILKRSLHLMGYRTIQVMNITDVGHLTDDADQGEDKVEKAAQKSNQDALLMTEKFKNKFFLDCSKLNILPPDIIARATDHIEEQIDLIKALEKNGHIYSTPDGIYFDVSTFSTFTPLENMQINASKEYSRVETKYKRNPEDFALWKFSPKEQKRKLEWLSPWGVGFPGWHIECSAMSLKYLGEYFDIHTGGVDHIPIHHTSEIRQMEAAVGHKVVNYWIHGAWLSFGESEKMSKSEGGTILLDNIIEKQIDPIAYRYLVLTAHYRNPLKFTWDSLDQAQTALRNLKSRISSLSIKKTGKINLNYVNKFKEVISNDLDTPKALSLLWQLIKDPNVSDNEKYNTFKIFDEVLGIDLLDYRNTNNEIEISTEILGLLQQREESRKNKDYATSDKLRGMLEEKGYKIKDGKDSLSIQET